MSDLSKKPETIDTSGRSVDAIDWSAPPDEWRAQIGDEGLRYYLTVDRDDEFDWWFWKVTGPLSFESRGQEESPDNAKRIAVSMALEHQRSAGDAQRDVVAEMIENAVSSANALYGVRVSKVAGQPNERRWCVEDNIDGTLMAEGWAPTVAIAKRIATTVAGILGEAMGSAEVDL